MTVKKNFSVSADIKRTITNNVFEVVSGDTGNTVTVTVMDGDAPVDLSGCRIIALYRSGAGTAMQDSSEDNGGITVGGDDGNKVTIELFPSSYGPGIVECELQIYSGEGMDTLITTTMYNFRCRASLLSEGALNATREYPLLVRLVNQCSQIATAESERQELAAKFQNMTVSAATLSAGSPPAALITESGGVKHLFLGIPAGQPGAAGRDGADRTDGVGIASITFIGQDAAGGNSYSILLTDGTSFTITAPKGEAGHTPDITVDSALSESSTNPVQNSTVTEAINDSRAFFVTVGLDGHTPDKSYAEISGAYSSGKAIFCRYTSDGTTYTLPLFAVMGSGDDDGYTFLFSGSGRDTGSTQHLTAACSSDGAFSVLQGELQKKNKLLTFTGGAVGSYDGSSALTIDIPKAAECIPDYVKAEANRLINTVLSHQTGNCVRFLVMSDAHQSGSSETVTQGNIHAGQAAKIVSAAIGLDFAAFLGDYTEGSSSTTIEDGISDIKAVNGFIADAFKGIPNFRTVGNHDGLWASYEQNGEVLDDSFLMGLIGSHMKHNITGGSYGYADFDRYKLRIICLNTAEGAAESISSTQLKWFAETALDFTGRQDWQFMVLSHHPLDWGGVCQASNILRAYVSGSSYSNGTVSVNYSGANGAVFIANFHGHTHCYKADNLHGIDNSVGTAYSALRVAIPGMCCSRSNEYGGEPATDYYGIEFGDVVSYPKTTDSAEDTAFCVITVDLDGRIIYADHYGAGTDRVISYSFASAYTNTLPTAQQYADSSPYNGKGYKDGVYISSGSAPYDGTDAGFFATGFIPYTVPAAGLPSSIYIRGAAWSSASHSRLYFFDADKSIIDLFINGNGSGNNAISAFFSVETLGDDYYRLTPLPSTSGTHSRLAEVKAAITDAGFIRLSLPGSGDGVIITLDEAIE